MPKKSTEPVEASGKSMMRRRMVWRVICIPNRAASLAPPLPQVANPKDKAPKEVKSYKFAKKGFMCRKKK